jgi:hypothetical protein
MKPKIVIDTSVFISALISINKLIEELSTIALAEHDAYTRFKAIAATGNPDRGLELLAKLDSVNRVG